MKVNPYRQGIFGVPNGDACVDTPDGVTHAYNDGTFRNNIDNAWCTDKHGLSMGAFDNSGMIRIGPDPETNPYSGTTSAPGQIKFGE